MPQYDPQIEYAAALAGMSPDEYVFEMQQQQARDTDASNKQKVANITKAQQGYMAQGLNALNPYGGPAYTPEARALFSQAQESDVQQVNSPYDYLAQSTGDAYNRQIAQLQPYQTALNQGYQQDAASRNQVLANQSAGLDAATNANNSYISGMQTAANQAGQQSNQLLGSYSGVLQQANNMDAATVGGLQARDAGMQQLTAGGYGANVVSDPRLVSAQQNVYDALGGFASGAYNVNSQAALAQADPEGLAAQKYTLGELKNRTDAKLTDAERAMFMQARLQREMTDSANRDANFRELAQRGMGGSTMALSNLNAGSMESGIQRALTDTQAAGYAQQRAEQALRDYGTLGGQIADQSFRRQFATGSAADQAAQFNVGTQMQGTLGQGQIAGQMRTADDAINTFNKSQQMTQQRFQDQFAADQQQQAWNRGTDIADARFKQSGNISSNATDYSKLAMGEIGDRYNRQADIGRTGVTATGQYTQGLGQLGQNQMAGLRDNSNQLQGTADYAGRMAALTAQGQNEANKYTALGVASSAEDRRALQAAQAASDENQRQRKWEQDNKSPWEMIFG